MSGACLLCRKELSQQVSWAALFSMEKEEWLCEECQSLLEEIPDPRCEICCRPLGQLDSQYIRDGVCNDCLRWEQDPQFKGTLEKNTSLYLYNDFLKELISQYKFRGDYILAKIFSEKVREFLLKQGPLKQGVKQGPLKQGVRPPVSAKRGARPSVSSVSASAPLIVPIPLSEEREWERGFNQAEALITNAGFTPTHLLKRIHSEKQSKKSRTERIHIPQVFQLSDPVDLTNHNIILVDDIYTTGSTLRHAAKILRDAGASSVVSLTIGR